MPTDVEKAAGVVTVEAGDGARVLGDEAPRVGAQVLRAEARTGERKPATGFERPELADLEESIYASAMQVTGAMLDFAEYDPADGRMPDGWVEKYGKKGAEKRLRIVQSSWQNAREAPVALAQATSLVKGISMVRARAKELSGDVTVQVAVAMPIPTLQFKKVVVEGD